LSDSPDDAWFAEQTQQEVAEWQEIEARYSGLLRAKGIELGADMYDHLHDADDQFSMMMCRRVRLAYLRAKIASACWEKLHAEEAKGAQSEHKGPSKRATRTPDEDGEASINWAKRVRE
jgi:hypothetical protein